MSIMLTQWYNNNAERTIGGGMSSERRATSRSWFAFILIGLGVLPPCPASADEPVRLATGMIEPWTTSDGKGFHQSLMRDAFARLGLKAEVEVIAASSRALTMANDGLVDGLAGRVAGLEQEYPALMPVGERMFVNDFVVCGRPGTRLPTDWSGLAPFSTAYVIGWQIFEHNLPPVRELATTKDSAQLLNLLQAGRVEVILHERWQILWLARKTGVSLVCGEQPLARVPMYVYLHRRHAGRAESVASVLRAMKADGSYEAIARKAFDGLGASVAGLK